MTAIEWFPDERLAICRLAPDAPVPDWAAQRGGFTAIVRTDRELSIVAPQDRVPADVTAERDWIACRVAGTLDLDLVGILAGLTARLAEAGMSVFAISTCETDYLLVRARDAVAARRALGG